MRRFHLSLLAFVGVLALLATLAGRAGDSGRATEYAAPPEPLKTFTVAPMPERSSLFQQSDGWIGGDGAYSVAISAERTLWLFSDTWVGKIRDGKRTEATIVNNTAAWQDGHDANASVRFFVSRDTDGRPNALIRPVDGHGWFWLGAGACANGRLYVFLPQFLKKGEGAFGFAQVGLWLGVVSNPLAPPTAWHVEQQRVPFALFTGEHIRSFGTAVLLSDGFLYVYGTDERRHAFGLDRRLIVARVPVEYADEFAAWRFYQDGEWKNDPAAATPVASAIGPEGSVTYLPRIHGYVLVYTELGLSDRVLARTALRPWGPWSAPVEIYRCPEMKDDKRLFCYGAKAHPSEAANDELVLTYFVNSTDFWQVAKDARLYWPRFVRVSFKD
jgi:hypothetical protein